MSSRQMALDALKKAKYAIKGREHTGFIDNAIAAMEADIAQAVEPGVNQLMAQLHDEQKWTVSEQQQFAQFLKRFPNESSQGIMSLGDAWMHGKSCAAPAVNAELLAELRVIADANPMNWDAPYNDTASFQAWAQSRARAAIAKATS